MSQETKILQRVDTMLFNETEMISLMNWISLHIYTHHGTGSPLKVSITQSRSSGIGVVSQVVCSCGEKHDFTDVSAW